MNIVYVAIGGALGSVLRYLAQLGIGNLAGISFPYGTLFVNIAGSFAMGLVMGWVLQSTSANGHEIRLFVAVGVLGGFTTFSSFSFDAIALLLEGKSVAAGIYIFTSLMGSLFALLG